MVIYTEEEKTELMSRVNYFMALAEKSRRDGLLSLEENWRDSPSVLLKIGLRLVIDGTAEEDLTVIIDNYIRLNTSDIYDLLDKQFLTQLQKGVSLTMIKDMSLSLIGREFAEEFYKKEENDEEKISLLEKEEIEVVKKIKPTWEVNPDLDTILTSLTHWSMQKFIRNLEKEDLKRLMSSVGGDVLGKIYSCFSPRVKKLFREDFRSMKFSSRKEEIQKTQIKILNQIKLLAEIGEVSYTSKEYEEMEFN